MTNMNDKQCSTIAYIGIHIMSIILHPLPLVLTLLIPRSSRDISRHHAILMKLPNPSLKIW
jgi:hypothetical protein